MRINVFDTEANNLYPAVDKIWCGCFTNLDGTEKHSFGPDQMQEMMAYMDTCDVLIGHNVIGYDFPMMKKVLGYEYKGKVVDTLIMSRILDPNRRLPPNAENRQAGPHSIYAWGVRVGVEKPEHEEWERYSEAMLHRCTEDTEINRLVYHALLKEAAGAKWMDAFKLSFKLFQLLQEQEDYGWMVDQDLMRKHVATLDNMIEEIDKQLEPILPFVVEVNETKKAGEYGYVKKPYLKSGKPSESLCTWYDSSGLPHDCAVVSGQFSRISFRKVDVNSRNESVQFLLDSGWEPKEWNTNDEGQRTSPKLSKDDPFEGVEGEAGKLLAKRMQCRHRRSLIEGLLQLVRPDGRIASAVNSIAATGRATHRNIVNIPAAKSFFGKECREVFIAAPGKVLVSTDSDQNQLRQLSARMGDEKYQEALVNGRKEDGTDVHTFAQRMAELDTRDQAKTFQYGVLFGAGDAKTGKIVGGGADRGKKLKEKFFNNVPGLPRLLDALGKEWKKTAKKRFNAKFNRIEYYDGTITGLDGRPIRVPYEHQLLVYLLQSDEAIQMAAAYIWTCEKLKKKYKWGHQVHVVCWYHDEYTFECDPDIAEDVKQISERGIAWAGEYFKIGCPHVGSGKIGHNWYEVH